MLCSEMMKVLPKVQKALIVFQKAVAHSCLARLPPTLVNAQEKQSSPCLGLSRSLSKVCRCCLCHTEAPLTVFMGKVMMYLPTHKKQESLDSQVSSVHTNRASFSRELGTMGADQSTWYRGSSTATLCMTWEIFWIRFSPVSLHECPHPTLVWKLHGLNACFKTFSPRCGLQSTRHRAAAVTFPEEWRSQVPLLNAL